VYVVGGVGQQTIETLSPVTNRWTELYPQLPFNATNTAVVPLTDNRLYLFGGSLQETIVFNWKTGFTEVKTDSEIEGAAFVGHS
jgi:hypothetical protein